MAVVFFCWFGGRGVLDAYGTTTIDRDERALFLVGVGLLFFLISGMVPAYGGSVTILHNLDVTVITDMYRVPVHTNRQRPSGSRRNRFARDSFLSG